MSEELTPKERVTLSDGQSLLKELQEMQPKKDAPAILGPDGQPATAAQVHSPAEMAAQHRKDMEEKQKKHVDELHARMKLLSDEDEDALPLMGVVLAAQQLIFWAQSELNAHCGVDEELLDFIERYMRQAAVTKTGFTLKQVISKFKQEVLPLASEYMKTYEAGKNRRLLKFRKVAQKLDQQGMFLPTPKMRKSVDGVFRPGDLMVVTGDPASVVKALQWTITCQLKHVSGLTYYLCSDALNTYSPPDHVKLLPRAWWSNAASHVRKLYEVLQPMVDDTSALVVIDDLELLYSGTGTEDEKLSPQHRKYLALARLDQWAHENFAAVLIGDSVVGDALDPKVYRGIPFFCASTVEVDGKEELRIDGEPLEEPKK